MPTTATRRTRRLRLGMIAAFAILSGVLAAPADAQPYATMQIETAPGGGAPLAPQTLTAGDTLRLFAAGYDNFGSYTGPVDVTWEVLPELSVVAPDSGTTTLLRATTPGTFQVRITDWKLRQAWSPNLLVVAGPPVGVAVFADFAGQTALDSLRVGADSLVVLYARSFDVESNDTGPVLAQWSLDDPLGGLQPPLANLTVFDPRRAGRTTLWCTSFGLAPRALPLEVLPGRLATLRIATRPDGPALADTTLAAGDSLHLYAAGADAEGNALVVPLEAVWAMSGTGGTLLAASGPQTILQALSPGSLRVSAAVGSIQASTGIVGLAAGPLFRVRLSQLPNAWVPLDPTPIDADAVVELFANGEDALGNSLGPVPADWASSDPSVLGPLGAAGTSMLFEAHRTGTARVAATVTGVASDTSDVVTVLPGRTARIRIETQPAGTGVEFGDATLTTDSLLVLYAAGRDADDNFTESRAVEWSLSSPLGTLSASPADQVTFDPTRIGSGRITAVDFLFTDATGTIDVLGGSPSRLRVVDETGALLGARALSPGESLRCLATRRDADDNPLGPAPALWSWAGDSLAAPPDSLTSEFVFQAGRTGRGRLVIEASGVLPDSSGWITVATGSLSRLEIHDELDALVGDRDLPADTSVVLRAVGFDAGGNPIGDVPVSWEVESFGGLATIEPRLGSSTVLRPEQGGEVRLHARHASALEATTGALRIVPGAAVRVAIEAAPDGSGSPVGDRTLVAGDSLVLYAVGRDVHGNATGPIEVAWIVSGDLGNLVPTFGASTTLVVTQAGSGDVATVHPSLPAARTGTLQVLPALPAGLWIERTPGDPADAVADSTLAVGDSLEVYAVARDTFGNMTSTPAAAWQEFGDAWAATLVDSGPAVATRVRAESLGTIQLRATWNGLVGTSGLLTIQAGKLARVTIETAPDGSGAPIGERSLTAGDLIVLYAVGRDAHGIILGPVSVNWAVEGGIGTLAIASGSSTTFQATGAGTGAVAVSSPGVPTARTGVFTVAPGPAAVVLPELTIDDPADPVVSATLSADDSLAIFAVTRDAYGNRVGAVLASWSLSENAANGEMSISGPAVSSVLRPRLAGTLRVRAEWNGLVGDTGPILVVAGRLARIHVETAADGSGAPVGSQAVAAGSSLALHAIGRDADGNFVAAANVAWEVQGDIGRVEPAAGNTTLFTAERAGSGFVRATHATLAAARTGDLVVAAGTAAALAVERTVEAPYDPIPALALSADDSLLAFAVLRDSLGNVAGSAPATWSLVGDSTAARLRPASEPGGIWFLPRRAAAVGLRAEWNGLAAASGTITIVPGAPVGSIALAAAPESLRADGVSQASLQLGPVSDRYGNPVPDGTRVDLFTTAGVLLDDLDPVRPGVQRPIVAGMGGAILVASSAPGTARVDAASGGAAGTANVTFLPPVALQFVPGSWVPSDAQLGTTLAAGLELRSGDALDLGIESGRMWFEDGNGSRFESPLAQPVLLPAAGRAALAFAPTEVSSGMQAGSYAPRIELHGTDNAGQAFDVQLALPASTIRVRAGGTARVTERTPDRLTRGATVRFAITVLNTGDADATLDPLACTLAASDGAFRTTLDPATDRVLEAGQPSSLQFLAAAWADSGTAGDIGLQLELAGTQPGGAFAETLTVAPVRIESPAFLESPSGGVEPQNVPLGMHPPLVVRIRNAGGSRVDLAAPTRLLVAGRTSALDLPVGVLSDSMAALEFAPLDLDSLPPGRLAIVLEARGTQNGAPFAQDLVLADSLVLFTPAALSIIGVEPSQPTVTRGQTTPWTVEVLLSNAGESTYRIDDAAIHVVLGGVDRTASYTWERSKPLAEPLAPASVDTLRFRVLRTGDDAGPATLEANVRAVDLATGETLDVDTYAGGKGSVRVQQPGSPAPGSIVLSQPAVSAGQARTIEARLTVRNAGEAALELDTATLATRFVTAPAVPVVADLATGNALLADGEELVVRYVLGPFDVAPGTLLLDATPRFVETNQNVERPVQARDSLRVHVPAALATVAAMGPVTVTAGQSAPWMARFAVQNAGESAVQIVGPRLVLQAAGADVGAGYTVVAPAAFDAAPDLVLGGGTTRLLSFTVTSTADVPRDLVLALEASALELESGRTLQVAPGTEWALRAQAGPRLVLADSTLAPGAASRGQSVQFTIEASNQGESTLRLDPATTFLRLAGTEAVAALEGAFDLVPGAPLALRFAPLAIGVPPGSYGIQVHLQGTENGNPWSVDVTLAGAFDVEAATSLEVLAVEASRSLVTRGQTRPWNVRVVVQNHGAAATFRSATLQFGLGTEDVSLGFGVQAPTAFESGAMVLGAAAIDTLRFEVSTTGDVEGIVVLDAEIEAQDTNSGEPRSARSLGGARGSIRVASPARPVITDLTTSQARVSAGQRADWNVRATLRNEGGTPWRFDPAGAGLAIGLAADDSLLGPSGFESGDAILESDESATALFTVTRTGGETGELALVARFSGLQETDDRAVATTTGPASSVRAQVPAAVRLDAVNTALPRAPYVNVGQVVPVAVLLANAGQAGAESVVVHVHAAGCTPPDTSLVLEVAGGATASLDALVRAATSGPVEIEASIESARDANDPQRTDAWSEPRSARLDLVAESPGALHLEVDPQQERVSAGQTSPWWIALEIENTGEELLRLGAPRASDLQFERSGIVQADYVIVPPESLESGGLDLPGGARGRLLYTVARTGSGGGSILVHARTSAEHRNDPAMPLASALADSSIIVDAEPGLRILSTESVTYRRLHGSDDFRIDAGQEFVLRVVVENTGGTWLDSILVGVDSQRGNSSITSPGLLESLAPGQRGALDLQGVAGTWLSQPGLPEVFSTYVLAARDRNSQVPVLPGAAVDNTSFAYVESPARLDLAVWIESPEGARDGIVSTSQQFVLAARADNLGSAAVTSSGRVVVELAPGFVLESGDAETFFVPGEPVYWTLRAPSTSTSAPESLTVSFAAIPLDTNDGEPADLVTTSRATAVQVRDVGGLATEVRVTGPAGATDGVLSTGQTFDLEIALHADPALERREADLLLPAGWRDASGASTKRDLPPDPQTSARWSLVAGLAPGTYPIVVQVTARDRNAEIERTTADTLQLRLEQAPRLAVRAAIVAPDEARDGRVLPGQRFRVRAWVHNHGEAAVAGSAPIESGTLRLVDLPAGYATDAPERAYLLGSEAGASVDWEITAASVYRPDVETLRFLFGVLPDDANAGTPAAVLPDSSTARLVVSLAADGVEVETTSLASAPAVPGSRRLPVLALSIVNQAEAAARLDSLGVAQILSGAPAIQPIVDAIRIVREDAPAETLVVRTASAPVAWFVFPATASPLARLDAQATVRYHVLVDLVANAPAGSLELALRATATSPPLVRVVEAGSGTPLPVRTEPRAPLVSAPTRIVEASQQAFNAPNPFHVGRETTAIRYAVDTSTEVEVRIATLQGELVWEHRAYEQVQGPELRAVVWDGRNGAGSEVRNGVYICQVRAGSRTTRFKIAVVR